MSALRLSAISFLNTAPLMWDIEHGDANRHFDIDYTIPSACAAALADGRADIGIIPAFTYAQIPGLTIIPDIAIASRDYVRSILLVSKRRIEEVRTVAVDTSSRTSVALLQVLFTKFFGGPRELQPHAPDLQQMLGGHDAALLIGDSALQVATNAGYHLYDLAHLWRRATGHAFLFAFWAIRQDSLARIPAHLNLTSLFQRSRDRGLQKSSLDAIAREWSPRLGLAEALICDYLTENIHYSLDHQTMSGFKLFLQLSQEIGLIEAIPELRFLHEGR